MKTSLFFILIFSILSFSCNNSNPEKATTPEIKTEKRKEAIRNLKNEFKQLNHKSDSMKKVFDSIQATIDTSTMPVENKMVLQKYLNSAKRINEMAIQRDSQILNIVEQE